MCFRCTPAIVVDQLIQPTRLSLSDSHRRISASYSFSGGSNEVTNAQFRRFVETAHYKTQAETDEPNDPMGSGGWGFNQRLEKFEGRRREFNWHNPGFTISDSLPVVDVTWNDCVAFCKWL